MKGTAVAVTETQTMEDVHGAELSVETNYTYESVEVDARGTLDPEAARELAAKILKAAEDLEGHYVSVVRVDRHFGGPEEGGWWWDQEVLISTEPAANRRLAGMLAEKLVKDGYLDLGNRFSVRPTASDYRVHVTTTPPPQKSPATAPTWE
jgi:hypothetical protein